MGQLRFYRLGFQPWRFIGHPSTRLPEAPGFFQGTRAAFVDLAEHSG